MALFKRKWSKLDNASKIFLAARSSRDSKVFRLTCECIDEVDPILLDQALQASYDEFPLFHYCVRRGIFWYYMEETELRPHAEPENKLPCAPIYRSDKPGLLFRVSWYKRRVHLEVFHSLTDGTGALWFLEDIMSRYFTLRYGDGCGEEERKLLRPPYLEQMGEDSFSRLFSNLKKPKETLKERVEKVKQPRVYHVRGTPTPDMRINITELHLSLKDTLEKSRAEGVSLTVYLMAHFVRSIYLRMPEHRKEDRITISVPINLRGRYASSSGRNFFAAVNLELSPSRRGAELTELCAALKEELEHKSSEARLAGRLRRLLRYEENPFLRLFPRVLKDRILNLVNRSLNRGVSLSISNLGRVSLPCGQNRFLSAASLSTAVVRPQMCTISKDDELTVTLLSPYLERDWQELMQHALEHEGLAIACDRNSLPREKETRSERRRREKAARALQKAEAEGKEPSPELRRAAETFEERRQSSAYPDIPLSLRPRIALKILSFLTLLTVAVSFIADSVWPSRVSWPNMVLLALINIWMYALIIVRKRRNIAKFFCYHTVLLCGAAVFWDSYLGWKGWSLDFAVPVICTTGLLTTAILIQCVKLEKGDSLLYLLLGSLIGLAPLLFLWARLVTVRLPSFISGSVAVALLLAVLIFRFGLIKDELIRRFHL